MDEYGFGLEGTKVKLRTGAGAVGEASAGADGKGAGNPQRGSVEQRLIAGEGGEEFREGQPATEHIFLRFTDTVFSGVAHDVETVGAWNLNDPDAGTAYGLKRGIIHSDGSA